MAGLKSIDELVSGVTGGARYGGLRAQKPPSNSLSATLPGRLSSVDQRQEENTVISNDTGIRLPYEVKCARCKDMRFLGYDVPYGHLNFGKLMPCPDCNPAAQPESLAPDCGLPPKLRDATFETIIQHEGIQAAYDAALERASQPREFFTLVGDTGRGKSLLLGATVSRAKFFGFSSFYTTTTELLQNLRKTFDTGTGYDALLERYKAYQVLVIDEFDHFNPTGWAREVIFHIVSWRFDYGLDRLTCFGTNASIDTFPPYLGSRMRDRRSCLFDITGMDVRLCDR